MSIVSELFKRMPIASLVDEQLYDTQRRLLEHEAAAEHHAALAEMYQRRLQRLQLCLRQEAAAQAQLPEDAVAIELKTGLRLRA